MYFNILTYTSKTYNKLFLDDFQTSTLKSIIINNKQFTFSQCEMNFETTMKNRHRKHHIIWQYNNTNLISQYDWSNRDIAKSVILREQEHFRDVIHPLPHHLTPRSVTFLMRINDPSPASYIPAHITQYDRTHNTYNWMYIIYTLHMLRALLVVNRIILLISIHQLHIIQ